MNTGVLCIITLNHRLSELQSGNMLFKVKQYRIQGDQMNTTQRNDVMTWTQYQVTDRNVLKESSNSIWYDPNSNVDLHPTDYFRGSTLRKLDLIDI